MRARGSGGGLVFSLSLALAGCSADEGRAPPLSDVKTLPTDRIPSHTDAFEPTACWVTVPAEYAVECGYVTAPARAATSGSGSVRLAVAIVYSNASKVAGDPVVFLDGGPGAASLGPLLGGTIPFQSILEDHDLVLFDQRGTGFSEPKPGCTRTSGIVTGGTDAHDAGVSSDGGMTGDGGQALYMFDALADCRRQTTSDGLDLSIYRSAESARDVTSIRKALGYERWNLYGVSYGTRYALATLRDEPDGVSGVILDSVVPPQADLLDDEGVSIYAALHAISTACLAQSDCNAAFGDIESKELTILLRMDAAPPRIPGADGGSAPVPASLAVALFTTLLYSGEAIPYLPDTIQRVYDEDYSIFEGPLASTMTAAVSEATYLSVLCAEEAPFSSRAVMDEKSQSIPKEWRRWLVPREIFDACAIWDVPAAPPLENVAVTSAVRTLVLSGSFDPVTPPSYGALAAQTLTHSQSVVLEDQSHGSSISDCGKRLVHAFLDGLGTTVDTACASGKALSFMTPTALAGPDLRAASGVTFVTSGRRLPARVLEDAVRRAARLHVRFP